MCGMAFGARTATARAISTMRTVSLMARDDERPSTVRARGAPGAPAPTRALRSTVVDVLLYNRLLVALRACRLAVDDEWPTPNVDRVLNAATSWDPAWWSAYYGVDLSR